jgi:hypothetical protein
VGLYARIRIQFTKHEGGYDGKSRTQKRKYELGSSKDADLEGIDDKKYNVSPKRRN